MAERPFDLDPRDQPASLRGLVKLIWRAVFGRRRKARAARTAAPSATEAARRAPDTPRRKPKPKPKRRR